LDAWSFIGVADAFECMTEPEVLKEAQIIQKALLERDYIKLDIDGNMTIHEQVKEAVDTCANCRAVIMTERQITGKLKCRSYYYEKNGRIYALSEELGGYCLNRVEGTDALHEVITQKLKWQGESNAPLCEVKLQTDILVKVIEVIEESCCQSGVDFLLDSGLKENEANAICDAITGKSSFYAISISYLSGSENMFIEYLFFDTNYGIYQLCMDPEKDKSFITFSPITADKVLEIYSEIVTAII
jgi:hypothetical protein